MAEEKKIGRVKTTIEVLLNAITDKRGLEYAKKIYLDQVEPEKGKQPMLVGVPRPTAELTDVKAKEEARRKAMVMFEDLGFNTRGCGDEHPRRGEYSWTAEGLKFCNQYSGSEQLCSRESNIKPNQPAGKLKGGPAAKGASASKLDVCMASAQDVGPGVSAELSDRDLEMGDATVHNEAADVAEEAALENGTTGHVLPGCSPHRFREPRARLPQRRPDHLLRARVGHQRPAKPPGVVGLDLVRRPPHADDDPPHGRHRDLLVQAVHHGAKEDALFLGREAGVHSGLAQALLGQGAEHLPQVGVHQTIRLHDGGDEHVVVRVQVRELLLALPDLAVRRLRRRRALHDALDRAPRRVRDGEVQLRLLPPVVEDADVRPQVLPGLPIHRHLLHQHGVARRLRLLRHLPPPQQVFKDRLGGVLVLTGHVPGLAEYIDDGAVRAALEAVAGSAATISGSGVTEIYADANHELNGLSLAAYRGLPDAVRRVLDYAKAKASWWAVEALKANVESTLVGELDEHDVANFCFMFNGDDDSEPHIDTFRFEYFVLVCLADGVAPFHFTHPDLLRSLDAVLAELFPGGEDSDAPARLAARDAVLRSSLARTYAPLLSPLDELETLRKSVSPDAHWKKGSIAVVRGDVLHRSAKVPPGVWRLLMFFTVTLRGSGDKYDPTSQTTAVSLLWELARQQHPTDVFRALVRAMLQKVYEYRVYKPWERFRDFPGAMAAMQASVGDGDVPTLERVEELMQQMNQNYKKAVAAAARKAQKAAASPAPVAAAEGKRARGAPK